ncbi:uncharacterized protein LOC122382833 isoform X2 [Amphibalanus amphitrite]|uniref:uncharacterized protein LOC122382833 isoform X2 n=1 Tax=Amphibalanus amphitrite TaxID=1232801 RepID=UPI001C923E9B|nr:uncharacterized protein LOC122382833 isoform X2 [Amphibalanus amphitrite]
MLSCNMISRLWIVMTIAINNAYIVSGEPRRYPRRLPRSCEARNVDNPCQNGGRCHVTVSAGDAAEPALVTCRCTPAWTGVTCELERDPCTDGSAVCGPGWSCVRNSSNTAAGYDCGCGARSGWQRLADGLPRCVDIDECALLAPACFNGGQCRNRAGSYECLCKPGFSGRRCELGAPPSRLSADGWHDWSTWSRCEGPCGAGQQKRFRICGRRRSGCPGEPEESRPCVPQDCRDRPNQSWLNDNDESGEDSSKEEDEGEEVEERWMEDGENQPHQSSAWGNLKTRKKNASKGSAVKTRHRRKQKRLSDLDEATDSDSKMEKLRQWRDTRTEASIARNWKLLHYLGFEPVRRKRSLAQIESYDDLELALMKGDSRSARDLGAEEKNLEEVIKSSRAHERHRRSLGPLESIRDTNSHMHIHKRSTDILGTYHENILGSLEDVGISMSMPSSQDSADGGRVQTVANLTVDGHRGILRVGQNVSSAAEALTDSSLEEALRRPAAAVRALVGPVVGRARAALLRLRLTEAARAERQEAALAAAEAAERQLRQIQEEVSRRAGKRRAAERRLWQLLDATESVARRGAETQRAARLQLARNEAAQGRLDAERRRRRQLRQNEAAAAANHAAVRASLLRRIQSARQQAVAQSRALTEARRQADSAEEKARKAAEVLRLERLELRRLEQAERQKLLDLQRHGVERLKAAVREAEHEERRAQEAEDERQRAEHQARPEPEPPPMPPQPPIYRDVKTGVRVRV